MYPNSNIQYQHYSQYILGNGAAAGSPRRPETDGRARLYPAAPFEPTTPPGRRIVLPLDGPSRPSGANEVNPTLESARQVRSPRDPVDAINTMIQRMSLGDSGTSDRSPRHAATDARLAAQANANNKLPQQRALYGHSQAVTPPAGGSHGSSNIARASPPRRSAPREGGQGPSHRSTSTEDGWELVTQADCDAIPGADPKSKATPGIVAHLYFDARSSEWVMESIGSRTADGNVLGVGQIALHFRQRSRYDPAYSLWLRLDGEEWAFHDALREPETVTVFEDPVVEMLERITNDLRVHVMVDCGGEDWFMGPAQIRSSNKFHYPDPGGFGFIKRVLAAHKTSIEFRT